MNGHILYLFHFLFTDEIRLLAQTEIGQKGLNCVLIYRDD